MASGAGEMRRGGGRMGGGRAHKVGEPVDGGDGCGGRGTLGHGEELGGKQPDDRSEAETKSGDEEDDTDDHELHLRGEESDGENHDRHDHPAHGGEQQHAPPGSVHQDG